MSRLKVAILDGDRNVPASWSFAGILSALARTSALFCSLPQCRTPRAMKPGNPYPLHLISAKGPSMNLKQWDFTESCGKTPFTGAELRAALEKEYPELYKILRDRHQHLKKLYHNFRDEHSANRLPGSISLHVGINSPCPCGSGKKYKRCCEK
jgi:hypothetical protein